MHKTCRFCLVAALGLTACGSGQDASVDEAGAAAHSSGEARQTVESPAPLAAGEKPVVHPAPTAEDPVAETHSGWRIPVVGVEADDLLNTWGDGRSAGRSHEGIDIMAPRGTPVVAAAAGRVVKKFLSERGGVTLYIALQGGELIHYYAHLDSYAEGVEEGWHVPAGTRIGYVGSSGNAPDDAPHLHFEVHRMNGSANWWEGDAVNPWPYFIDF